jgi:putative spermidine/putrescine transport system ATP-binding protein
MSIELRNISKRFGPVVALRDVNLRVEERQFVTLLGPSGCGKTTLLRIVAGLIQPDEGEVLIDGRLMNGVGASRRPTAMVFQDYALFPHMTVEANISFGLRMHGVRGPQVRHRVDDVADLVGITDLLQRYPQQISGGQRQRVALARTLAIEPSALLLDEPLAALDRKLRIEMRSELRKLLQRVEMTALFVTHDQEEALTMSDRIAVMDRGQVVQFGSPMEIYDRPQTSFVASFIGNSNLLTGVVRLAGDGLPVLDVQSSSFQLPVAFEDSVGQQIMLLLRPEHLTLQPCEPHALCQGTGIAGTIRYLTHLGMAIDYEVELEQGAHLHVQTSRGRDEKPLEVGARVCVTPTDALAYLRVAHD